MKLLDSYFSGGHTKIQYSSLESKHIWSDKINTGNNFYNTVELESVKHGVRKAMLLHNVNPQRVPTISRELIKHGLGFFPLTKGLDTKGSFSHIKKEFQMGQPFNFNGIVAPNIEIAEEYFHASSSCDDYKIGQILGFPSCCCEFFNENWKKGYFDPIWQQYENGSNEIIKSKKEFEDTTIPRKVIRVKAVDENYKIISALRYIGIRVISHFACCPNCKKSIEIADDWIQLGRDLKVKGLDETLEILQLPFEWNCLKGTAIVTTPAFKFFAPSVPCFPVHIVQQEGHIYPEDAKIGLKFPWNENNKKKAIK